MPTTWNPQTPVLDRYPDDGMLRGYFYLNDTDIKGADHTHRKCRRNIDFLRLKDFALQLLDPKPGSKIFDMGCGRGALMTYCGL